MSMTLSPLLSVTDLNIRYDGSIVVPNFTLDVAEKEFVSLLGPSGCGKNHNSQGTRGFHSRNVGHNHARRQGYHPIAT